MKTKQLGNSDLFITPVGFGAWAIGGSGWEFAWGAQDDNASIAAIHRALELGVNWIDTAAVYGTGHSEEVVARALASWRGPRPYVFTKCGLRWDGQGKVHEVLKTDSIRRECEDSLRRLRVEAIDLYQIHWPVDDTAELEEGWTLMAQLQQEGKVRWIGVSNFNVEQMQLAQSIAPITSLQPPYSLIRPEVEDGILPYCHFADIGVVVYSPMASGLLTGAMTREAFPNCLMMIGVNTIPISMSQSFRRTWHWWNDYARSASATTPSPAQSPLPGHCGTLPSPLRSLAHARRSRWTTWSLPQHFASLNPILTRLTLSPNWQLKRRSRNLPGQVHLTINRSARVRWLWRVERQNVYYRRSQPYKSETYRSLGIARPMRMQDKKTMPAEQRQSGIEPLGEMPWGTHFCHFYETKQDLLDISVPYFKAGLESNEFCLWIISPSLSVAEATGALKNSVPDFEKHLANRSMEILVDSQPKDADWHSLPGLKPHFANGSIEIVPYEQLYLAGGKFDSTCVINRWKEKLDHALARGFAGMQVHGDEAWLRKADWKSFLAHEEKLNQTLANQRMIVLCTYPLSARRAGEVFDVARAHHVAIARRYGQWAMLETPEIKQTKTELAALKADLEHRVHQRTSELAAVNQQLQESENTLRQSERQLRLVIDTIPVMAWILLPDGTVDFLNQRWLEYTGLSLKQAIEHPTSTVHPEDLPRVMEKWRRDMAAGKSSEDEMRLRRADGQYRWFLVRTAPLFDKRGNILRWYGTSTDIEDRKRAEEALRETQAVLAHVARASTVGELTACIAHEVNQPLGAIVTNAEAGLHWLSDDSPNLNEAREALLRIIRDGSRASEVVERIRSLLKNGKASKTRFGLDDVIGEIVALTKTEAQRRNVSVQTRLEPDLPQITADRVQLQQVLMNLVMNSLDALTSVADRPRILTILAGTDSPTSIRVSVRDTGPGIDRHRMNTIFEPFQTTKPHGLGLGLSISRSIIEAHGGHLRARRNDGPGVTFEFTLPVKGDSAV